MISDAVKISINGVIGMISVAAISAVGAFLNMKFNRMHTQFNSRMDEYNKLLKALYFAKGVEAQKEVQEQQAIQTTKGKRDA